METRNLAGSGLRVSAMGLGVATTWPAGSTMLPPLRVVNAALDLGITLFDTADVYPLGKSGMSLTHSAPLGTFPSSL
jgi:aryl-alcohol dehydrogenase-like predicted oxidoreductase